MTETATETKARTFETVTCSRCGGSGRHSWCERFRDICFKCGGRKVVYTKRGAAARRYFEESLSIPASEIRPGMKVKALRFTNGGEIAGEEWVTVTELEDNAVARRVGFYPAGVKPEDGKPVYSGINIIAEKKAAPGEKRICVFSSVNPATMYRVAADGPTKRAALERALDYQETLTKNGEPRKR